MNYYTITNPGRSPSATWYSMRAVDFAVAACAVTLIGEGRLGVKARDLSENKALPPLLGKPEPLGLFAKIVGVTFEDVMGRRHEIVRALRTVTPEDPEAEPTLRKRALQIADALAASGKPPTPQDEDDLLDATLEALDMSTAVIPPEPVVPPPTTDETFSPGGGDSPQDDVPDDPDRDPSSGDV